MEKNPQQDLEIELFSHPTLNPAIHSAIGGLKSFSPGEVYEFLQHKFPLQALKSKAHAKTGTALIAILHELLDNADLEKSEINQIKLYVKTLESFITQFEASAAEIAKPATPPPAPKKNKFSETILSKLKATAEAERKSILGALTGKAKKHDDEIVEAKFRKVKKR